MPLHSQPFINGSEDDRASSRQLQLRFEPLEARSGEEQAARVSVAVKTSETRRGRGGGIIITASYTKSARARKLPELPSDGVRRASAPSQIVSGRDAHDQHNEGDPDDLRYVADTRRESPANGPLDEQDRDLPAIERRNREKVQQAEVYRNERGEPDHEIEPLLALLLRHLIERDGTGELVEEAA